MTTATTTKSTAKATPAITPQEVQAPNLPMEQRHVLAMALMVAQNGQQPVVHVTYSKVTKSKPRLGGEHYREMPGVAPTVHSGPITAVARNKKGEVYFRLRDNMRLDPRTGEPMWTALKPEGLTSFMVLGFAAPVA